MYKQLSLFEDSTSGKEDVTPAFIDTNKLRKFYYTITEVAAMFHVNASLLRFWEKEFPTQLGDLKKNKKGDRYYNKKDIETIKLLYYLIKDKRMTLEGARDFLKHRKKKVKDEQQMVEDLKKIKYFLSELRNSIHDE